MMYFTISNGFLIWEQLSCCKFKSRLTIFCRMHAATFKAKKRERSLDQGNCTWCDCSGKSMCSPDQPDW